MSLRILRHATVASLRKSVAENLELYRSGRFDFLDLDPSHYLELPVVTDDGALQEVVMPVDGKLYEVENCMAVQKYLADLTPYDARDERLWCYLCHTEFLDYSRARWPIPDDDDKAVTHITTHFFARSQRQVERDNAVSRLWWMAHVCSRLEDVRIKDALEAFLFRSDVRASIVERPTTAQSEAVFKVILVGLIKSYAGQKALFERSTFRQLMVELNSIGGFRLLDALPETELRRIFSDVVRNRIGLGTL